jgi:hypothetical protein
MRPIDDILIRMLSILYPHTQTQPPSHLVYVLSTVQADQYCFPIEVPYYDLLLEILSYDNNLQPRF